MTSRSLPPPPLIPSPPHTPSTYTHAPEPRARRPLPTFCSHAPSPQCKPPVARRIRRCAAPRSLVGGATPRACLARHQLRGKGCCRRGELPGSPHCTGLNPGQGSGVKSSGGVFELRMTSVDGQGGKGETTGLD
eukprot:357715-Chlamydomonas_euryale.AAC.18